MVEGFIVLLACLPGGVIAEVGKQTPNGEPLSLIGGGLVLAAVLSLGVLDLIFFCQGKSIGKKIFGLTVYDCTTGMPAGFLKTFLRDLLPNLVSCVPVVGALVTLIDVLFIFSSDRRRLVDRICNTVVVAD